MDGFVIETAALLDEAPYREPEHWSELFKLEHYDWSDPEWLARDLSHPRAWLPVWLTKGYFAAVSPAIYECVAASSWRANVQRDRYGNITRVYAIRNGRKREGEPSIVYMHREITNAWSSRALVDHTNSYGLDNRNANLRRAGSYAENSSNKRGIRTKNTGLPIGVEKLRNGRYRGVVYRRVEGKRRSMRSLESWPTPEPAAQWYQSKLATLHRREEWVHNPSSVSYPDFPPRLESDVSEQSWHLRRTERTSLPKCDIPF